MTDASRLPRAGAVLMLVAAMLLYSGVGPGAGVLVGLGVPFGILGSLAVPGAGFGLVYSRSRDI